MKILVAHDSSGVHDCFIGSDDEILSALRASKYWEGIMGRLDYLFEDEITVDIVNIEINHDADSKIGFTLLDVKQKVVPHEKKVKQFTAVLNLCKFGVSDEHTDLMVSLYDLLLEKGGEANLKDIIEVQTKHKERFPEPEKPKEDENVPGKTDDPPKS